MRDDSADVLLREFLGATAEPEADLHLARILDELARPIVRRIVASVVRDAPDAEDVVADTLTDLLRRLRDLRGDRSREIHDLKGYIVSCAYNRCHERLRERYPTRTRLRNHLHYLFNHRPELALWRSTHGTTVCGMRAWMGHPPVPDARAESLTLPARADSGADNRAQINALAATALRHLGAPIEVDALVDLIARSIHLEQQRIELPLTDSDVLSLTATETDFDLRMSLRQLWEDIRELSPRQRAALLLNLRDAHGRESLSLLPHTGTATVAEIAEEVRIPPAEFERLWQQLPLTDAAIGDLLGATARQVIKLRRLARERLGRMTEKREKSQLAPERRNPPQNSNSSLAGIPVKTGGGGRTRR